MNLGVRELRDNLSKQLARVKEGHTVVVTEHGKVIARIVPAGAPTVLEQLIADGKVTPARRRKGKLPSPVDAGAVVSDLVAEQRR